MFTCVLPAVPMALASLPTPQTDHTSPSAGIFPPWHLFLLGVSVAHPMNQQQLGTSLPNFLQAAQPAWPRAFPGLAMWMSLSAVSCYGGAEMSPMSCLGALGTG